MSFELPSSHDAAREAHQIQSYYIDRVHPVTGTDALTGVPQSDISPPSYDPYDLPADQYYDHTGTPPAAMDYAEISSEGDTPDRTPPALWKGPWKLENFPGGPRWRDRRPQTRDWREPLPPPEPPRTIPLLENMQTLHDRSVARQKRIGKMLLEVQRRLGLLD